MAAVAKAVRFCGPKGPDLVSLLYISQRHKSTNITTTNYKRGTGGRSSFNGKVVTVFGAKSPLGYSLVNRLGKTGSQVICAYRGDPYYMRDFKVMGDLGQILFSEIDLRDEDSLRTAIQYSDYVINLIGREYETKSFSFDDIHVKGARAIAKIAKEYDVSRLVHVSTMSAGVKSNVLLKEGSKFLQSKYEGELAVREEFPEAIIFRPARFIDLNDKFMSLYFNKHRYYKSLPFLTPITPWHPACENIIRMPVRIKDVAQGIANALDYPDAVGQTYQAVGPHAYKQIELVRYLWMCKAPEKDHFFSTGSFFRVKLLAKLIEMRYQYLGLPLPTLTMEMLEKECVSEELDPDLPTLVDLGITPEDVKTIVEYIYRPGLDVSVFRDKSYIVPKIPGPPVKFATY